jgi:hypothetical protein
MAAELDIRSLLAKSYSASSIPQLEDYVLATCRCEVPYVFDTMRTLVKLYQLFPVTTVSNDNAETASALIGQRKKYTGYACVLSMQHGDLLALQYIIPKTAGAPNSDSPVVAGAIQCASLLDACLFTEFWTLYSNAFVAAGSTDSDDGELLVSLTKSAIPTLQKSILSVLALSYKEAPIQFVMDSLNVTSAEDIQSLSSPVVELVTETTVVFQPTIDNTKRQRVYQEGVSFSTVSALMQKMNAAQ